MEVRQLQDSLENIKEFQEANQNARLTLLDQYSNHNYLHTKQLKYSNEKNVFCYICFSICCLILIWKFGGVYELKSRGAIITIRSTMVKTAWRLYLLAKVQIYLLQNSNQKLISEIHTIFLKNQFWMFDLSFDCRVDSSHREENYS